LVPEEVRVEPRMKGYLLQAGVGNVGTLGGVASVPIFGRLLPHSLDESLCFR
jgi:hypothetical protein